MLHLSITKMGLKIMYLKISFTSPTLINSLWCDNILQNIINICWGDGLLSDSTKALIFFQRMYISYVAKSKSLET